MIILIPLRNQFFLAKYFTKNTIESLYLDN